MARRTGQKRTRLHNALAAWVVKCACPNCPNAARDSSPFCSRKCAKADNRRKWKSAPAAIAAQAGEWTGVSTAVLLPHVERCFDWLSYSKSGQARRRYLMDLYGYTWEAGKWTRNE